jgi:hypothetical protein
MTRRPAQNTSPTYYATYTQRDHYASAVRSMAAIGPTSRDIGEALRIGPPLLLNSSAVVMETVANSLHSTWKQLFGDER